MTKKTATKQGCVCGSRAYFVSKVTLFERLRFLFGFDEDSDLTLTMSDKPIAGRSDIIDSMWPRKAHQEVVRQ